MNKAKKTNLKIIAACSVAIFSLATLFGGSYAWFTLVMSQQIENDNFAVVNNGHCELFAANLIKFDYATAVYGSGEYEFTAIDYLNPENGEVNMYGFDKERNSFGYIDEDSQWVPVDAMNVYDPIESIIFGSELKDLNCNAVYEFTVTADDFDDALLNSTIVKLMDKIKEDDELFLTSCVNFDLFTVADLSDDNPAFHVEDDPSTPEDESYKPYYPSYIPKTQTLTENEEIYYRSSFLASVATSHPHFYGGSAEAIALSTDKDVTFNYDSTLGTKVLKFYVNVDYAPSELEYTQSKIYLGNIKAVYDFMFEFNFEKKEND